MIENPNPYGPLTNEWLIEFENQIGHVLPEPYRRFLLTNNGGKPNPGMFSVPSIGLTEVALFFGVHDGPTYASLKIAYSRFRERLRTVLLPIAEDDFGNIVAIKLTEPNRGAIYLGDREEGDEEGYDRLYWLANSFSEFLELLSSAPQQ